MDERPRLPDINESSLIAPVQMALEDATATIGSWTVEPIQDGLSGFAVARIRGTAQTQQGLQPWSLILKVIHPANGGALETDFDYWQREVEIYRSTLLTDLPAGLRVPRCYTIVEREAAEISGAGSAIEFWLWLEDMGQDDSLWPLEQYGVAARHLGQMNGAYLVDRPLPNAGWLRRPDVHERLALAEDGIPLLPEVRQQPYFAELLGGDRVERITRLWGERHRLLDRLNQLPQTFCHRDAGRLNLLAKPSDGGPHQIAVVDWGTAGLGMLGEEIVPLFAATLAFVEMDIAQIPMMERLIFDGYVAGLRDVGWDGDERLVRFGFTALAALKRGVADPGHKIPRVAKRIAALPPGVQPPQLLDAGGVKQASAVGRHLLGLGEEALTILDKLEHL